MVNKFRTLQKADDKINHLWIYRTVRDTQDSYLPSAQGQVCHTWRLPRTCIKPAWVICYSSQIKCLAAQLNYFSASWTTWELPSKQNSGIRICLQLQCSSLNGNHEFCLWAFKWGRAGTSRWCHDLPKFHIKSYYCFSVILMSDVDNVPKVLFLALVFFMLVCQSVLLIIFFYPRWRV